MKIIANQLLESVVCTLSTGDQVEVTMLRVEGEECFAEPSIDGAIALLLDYFACSVG